MKYLNLLFCITTNIIALDFSSAKNQCQAQMNLDTCYSVLPKWVDNLPIVTLTETTQINYHAVLDYLLQTAFPKASWITYYTSKCTCYIDDITFDDSASFCSVGSYKSNSSCKSSSSKSTKSGSYKSNSSCKSSSSKSTKSGSKESNSSCKSTKSGSSKMKICSCPVLEYTSDIDEFVSKLKKPITPTDFYNQLSAFFFTKAAIIAPSISSAYLNIPYIPAYYSILSTALSSALTTTYTPTQINNAVNSAIKANTKNLTPDGSDLRKALGIKKTNQDSTIRNFINNGIIAYNTFWSNLSVDYANIPELHNIISNQINIKLAQYKQKNFTFSQQDFSQMYINILSDIFKQQSAQYISTISNLFSTFITTRTTNSALIKQANLFLTGLNDQVQFLDDLHYQAFILTWQQYFNTNPAFPKVLNNLEQLTNFYKITLRKMPSLTDIKKVYRKKLTPEAIFTSPQYSLELSTKKPTKQMHKVMNKY